jgi:hypothetical protein
VNAGKPIDPGKSGDPAKPASIVLIGGTSTTPYKGGSTLLVYARVLAANQQILAGQIVDFTVSAGGTLVLSSVATQADFDAAAIWTLSNQPGNQQLTATVRGTTLTATRIVTVAQAAPSKVEPPEGFGSTLAIGAQMHLVARDGEGAPVTSGVTWTSSAPSVIAVSDTGWIEAKAAGEADIRATANGVTTTQHFSASATASARSPYLQFRPRTVCGVFCASEPGPSPAELYPIAGWNEAQTAKSLLGDLVVLNPVSIYSAKATVLLFTGIRPCSGGTVGCVTQGDMEFKGGGGSWSVCVAGSIPPALRVFRQPYTATAGNAFYRVNLWVDGAYMSPPIDINPVWFYVSGTSVSGAGCFIGTPP